MLSNLRSRHAFRSPQIGVQGRRPGFTVVSALWFPSGLDAGALDASFAHRRGHPTQVPIRPMDGTPLRCVPRSADAPVPALCDASGSDPSTTATESLVRVHRSTGHSAPRRALATGSKRALPARATEARLEHPAASGRRYPRSKLRDGKTALATEARVGAFAQWISAGSDA